MLLDKNILKYSGIPCRHGKLVHDRCCRKQQGKEHSYCEDTDFDAERADSDVQSFIVFRQETSGQPVNPFRKQSVGTYPGAEDSAETYRQGQHNPRGYQNPGGNIPVLNTHLQHRERISKSQT
ncbi:MAG: hypothetical protein DRI57_32185 [Deltaproteobacteria bacterium]|nr:MAG: hypothetical protein DRI57_32185 [Deltaproteobacteria bacterium]